MPRGAKWALGLGALAAGLLGLQAILAQVTSERGIAPIAASGDISVGGIEVDVSGKSAEDAREKGWKLAQRKAWEKLKGGSISDSQLESMVAAVVIEKEQIGSRRYVATLGVVFDKARSGAVLGSGGVAARSAPMLTVPVLFNGGTSMVYEFRNPWQRVWAEFQTGGSRIDYVRPSGAGGESLLVNYGQTGRRSRAWWNEVLSNFGATDVILPIARLERQWPGGPVQGTFTARYGPDSKYLGSFTMTAESEDQLPAMLVRARDRFDEMFTSALVEGKLTPDPTLGGDGATMDPTIAALVEAGRAAEAAEQRAAEASALEQLIDLGDDVASTAPQVEAVNTFTVQFATPDAAAVDTSLASVRSSPGVRGAATSSIAIGGVSVMRVTYGGSLDQLAGALRARGWQVRQGTNALSISR